VSPVRRAEPLPATLTGFPPRRRWLSRWLTFLAAAWLPTRPTTLKGR
jgi:hypothetical protein